MLREEQAAELLRRCESVVGYRLDQVRGNLRNSETRTAAVWELIVFEEVSRIGVVEYEPGEGASPDIRLTLPSGRVIWIEVAFLYPRFWREERQSRAVSDWITNETIRRKISPFKVACRFDGDRTNRSGPVRCLPGLHNKNQFLAGNDVFAFFDQITRAPNSAFHLKHSAYSIEFSYSPNRSGPYLSTGGGLVQEAPKDVKRHALYRVLREKARQHDVNGARLIFVGSDQSPALSTLVGPGNPTVQDAVFAAFRTTGSISGAIVFRIEDQNNRFGRIERIAKGDIYLNPTARVSLVDDDLASFQKLNFNRWKYFFRMDKVEPKKNEIFRRVMGELRMICKDSGVVLEVPANLLVDSLAGKTSLKKEYGNEKDDPILRCLHEGWAVRSCSFKDGDIEKGEAPKVVLELQPPPEAVYWPAREAHKNPMDDD